MAHLIKKVAVFIDNPHIDNFHYTMFHGLGSRKVADGAGQTYFLGDKLIIPLDLCINLYRPIPLFQPRLSLVASEEVREELQAFANVEFFQANIKKCVMIPYTEGNFDRWGDPNYQDDGDKPLRLLLDSRDCRHMVAELPQYFEIICANLERIKSQFTNL